MVDVICVFGIQGTKVADFLKGLKSWKQTHPVSIRLKKNRKKSFFSADQMVLLIVPNGPQFLEICHPCPSVHDCYCFLWARIIFYDTYLTLLTSHTRGQLIILYQPMKMWSIYNVHLVLSSSPVDRLFIMCAGVLSHCPNHLAAPPASTVSPTFFVYFH